MLVCFEKILIFFAVGLLFTLFPFEVTAREKDEPGFEQWLVILKQEAVLAGIKSQTLEKVFSGVKRIPRVIELDRKQPEFKLTLAQYLQRTVSQKRIEKGRSLYRKNLAMFKRITRQFGVEPQYLVALWGIETDFGRVTGDFPVIGALATLAHDGRRSSFFREELIFALRIADDDLLELAQMKGSWAGAMGHLQFLPSVFYRFGIDYDGDGRINIWNSQEDIFASGANYLKKSGWQSDLPWGSEVTLLNDLDSEFVGLQQSVSLGQWKKMGVKPKTVSSTISDETKASLILPDEKDGKAFLIFENFKVILKWNRANAFACAVGILADQIKSP